MSVKWFYVSFVRVWISAHFVGLCEHLCAIKCVRLCLDEGGGMEDRGEYY